MRLLGKKTRSLLLIIILTIIITVTVLARNGRFSAPPPKAEKSRTKKINNYAAVPLVDHDSSQNITMREKYTRNMNKNSPFHYLINNANNGNVASDNDIDHLFSMDRWHKTSKKDQCQLLVDAIYAENEDWTNSLYLNLHIDNKDIYPLMSLYSERMRIFYHCFLMNDVKLSDVFSQTSSRTPLSFQHKMFPFLKYPKADEALLPKVTNLTSMERVPFVLKSSIKEHNENFWSNWIQMSHGKGIVMTFPERDFTYFEKLVDVLGHLNNTLPIQVVVTEEEFSDKTVNKISELGKKNNQDIVLVTFNTLIDKENRKYISKYMNKFFASYFNTFEEFILMDADVVPFIEPKEFFEFDEYKSSGMYITRDRDIREFFPKECPVAFYNSEPTIEEVELIDTSFKFTNTTLNNETKTGEFAELYFRNNVKHLGESGLMMINKRENLPGIISALMLMLTERFSECSHGDKELFWLGQLVAGLDFEFEPESAAVMGFPVKEYDDQERYLKTTLHDDHLAHTHNRKLVWTNGGMAKFKVRNDRDKKAKNSRMRLNGFMIPDRRHGLWSNEAGNPKLGPGYRCTAVEVGSTEEPHGVVEWLSEEEFEYFEGISKVWNGNDFEEKDSTSSPR